MGAVTKEVLIGFVVAIFATVAGVFLYLEYFSRYGFTETLELIREGDLYGKVIALAAISNLFVFFIYIKKKQDYRARGVLIATILTALFTAVLKFI